MLSDDDYRQPSKGYRFTEDSVSLAGFAPQNLKGRAADLGAGCGVVGLEALAQGRLVGLEVLFLVEVQRSFEEHLLANIRTSLAKNPNGPALQPVWADWRELTPADFGGVLDHVMVNPPYFPAGASGRSNGARSLCRHEIRGGLDSLLAAAKRLLRPRATLTLSWPRSRLNDLVETAEASGFVPSRFCCPPRLGSRLILAEYSVLKE
ncbi:MAG: hypothetical protein LBJ64_08495 [Deltaproteobacteria bacterium]|nr:hypothetical protein [Deltaproteobacteria bacterium]